MNQIEEESLSESENSSNANSSQHEENQCLFDINEEIYELLLGNMVTKFNENEQIQVEFNNLKKIKVEIPKSNLKFQEVPLYSQTIIVNPKKVFKKACLIYLDDKALNKTSTDNMSLDFQFFNQIRDINIAKIFIQTIDICVEVLTSAEHTLKDLKIMTLKNLEALYKESFATYDLDIFAFSVKDFLISKQDEELSLAVMISKNNLDEALIGNIFNINMRITDKNFEMDIIKTILSKSKEPNEKLRTMIKLENNNKLSKRILIIRADGEYLYVLLMKVKEDDEIAFPLSSIKNIEKVPFKKMDEDSQEMRIKISFIDELKWNDFYVWFLSEKFYIIFLEIFLEFTLKKQKKTNKNIVPIEDLKKVNNQKTDKNFNENLTLEEILQKTKDINMILDHLDEQQQKHMEELKKIDESARISEENFEKSFTGKIKSILKIKCDRIIKFTNTFDIEIFSSGKSFKLLSSYKISEFSDILIRDSEKAILDFKNKKIKYIKIYFKSSDEAQAFANYYHNVILENYKKMNTLQSSSSRTLFNKEIKRYSWLCQQNIYNISKMKDIKDKFYSGKIVDIHFNVINITKQGGDQKQILHLNFINNVLTLLKPNQDLVKQMDIKKIVTLSHCFYDHRKVILSLKQRNLLNKPKKIELVFQDIKTKFLFFSSFYSISYPEAKEIPKPKFRVYITTWNVGFSEPPHELTYFFLKNIEDCDIITIAVQECKYHIWIEKLGAKMKVLKYTLLTVVTMWRMMMCVFIKNQHVSSVSNLEVVSKPTGIANLIGNKGGLLVSFSILETSFCFISSHLAAKPHNVELRKNNYYDLIKNMRTGIKELEPVFQFDYVFWCGDLNFRNDLLFEKVVELCQLEDYEKLQEFDQLTKERDENNIFSDFNEGPLNFRPTYRRIRNDDTWSNKKNQSPSWCDRVLFRCKPNSYLELLEYGSREQQYGSDHRPVYAKFEIEIDTPYLGNPHLHLRKKNPDGFFRFNEISLEYDMKSLNNLSDFVQITYPFELSLTFAGKFLKNTRSTGSLKIDKYDEAYSLKWEKDQIPVLQAVVSDFKYLKGQHIVFTITALDHQNNEVLIGQGYISLLDLIENNGTKTIFDTNSCLFGKIIGVLQGTFEYDIEHAEVLIL